MKIKPVKNYKKPLYAVAAATAAGVLSGCTPQLAGDVTVVDGAMDIPPDVTTVTSEEIATDFQTEGIVHISDDEQQKINNFWISYENEMKKKDEYLNAFAKHGYNLFLSDSDESEQCSTCDFGSSLAEVAFDSRQLFVGFYTEEISDDFVYQSRKATDYGYIFNRYGYCVALIDINESTDGRIDEIVEAIVNDYRNYNEIPADAPAETAVALSGDVAFVPDEEEEFEIAGGITLAPDETCAVVEEFSLAGDIAIPPDYNADNIGMEYAEQYISAFAEKGITLTETPDGDWGPFALGFETIPFIISLESAEHNIYLGFYSSENTALIEEIENAGGVSFGYGYCLLVCHEDIYYKLVLVDVDSAHSEYTDFIADYVALF